MENTDRKAVESILIDKGFEDFKWIPPEEVIVAQWVRFKCTFGCGSYNTKGSCPPYVPDVESCRKMFSEYEEGLLIRIPCDIEDPDARRKWSKKIDARLVKVERGVFLLGNRKAFITYIGECQICKDCAVSRHNCKHKNDSRPSPEGLAVDVFGTARKFGFPIEVLTDYDQKMNRYAILLVE